MLETAEEVQRRQPSSVTTFWPAYTISKRDFPLVFCHVEGEEEALLVTTEEGNEQSKYNKQEQKKAVCLV